MLCKISYEVTLDKINISCIEPIPQALVWPYQQAAQSGLQPPHLLLPPLQQSLQPPPLALLGSDYLTASCASTTLHQVRFLIAFALSMVDLTCRFPLSPIYSIRRLTARDLWRWLHPTLNVQNAPNNQPSPCRSQRTLLSKSRTGWTVTISRLRCSSTKRLRWQQRYKHRTTSVDSFSTSIQGWFRSPHSRHLHTKPHLCHS